MPGCSRCFVNLTSALALFAGVLCAAPTSGQFTIKENSDLVVLNVSVKNGSGHNVPGLSKNDFEVLDDNHRQKISYFATTDTPATVGLVLDDSGSMVSKRRDVILAGLSFASISNPRDQYFVVNFNDRLQYGLPKRVPFTDDMEQLRKALNWGQPRGQTRLYDAIASALEHMSESTQNYHVLIVVSDGGDNASHIGFGQLLHLVEESRATIYTVGLMDPVDRDLNPTVLKKLSKVSGGEYFQPSALDDVVPVFRHLSNEIRQRYVLGFVPDESDGNNVRTVRVRASEGGHKLSVRTRTTYVLNPDKETVATDRSKDVL